MRNHLFLLCFILPLLVVSCRPTPKSGYVRVPTVTENALSGVYTMSPKSPTAKLYYEELGEGEPVILLHAHSVDCRMWDDVFFKLAKKYRVIRYDLRGYGKSDMPEVGFGFLQADDLKNFMDALGIQKAHLAGLSLGGMTLADFVALYPERVLTATITSGAISAFPDRSSAPKFALKIYNDTVFSLKREEVEKNKQRGIDTLKMEWKKAMKSVSGQHYRSIKKKLNGMIDDWQAWQWTHPETDAFIGDQADSLLSKQKTHPPVLFLIGQRDSKGSKRSMQRMAALCRESRIQNMQEAGHFTAMECPEEFVEKMEKFIESKRSVRR
jgi:pimeloyl-ACP methyl ester carboxylesterase